MFKFNKKIKFGDIILSNNSPICIVAEAGINHNGRFAVAKKLIDEAVKAGADIVKFQTFKTEEFMTDKNEIYSYKVKGKEMRESLYKMFKRLELPYSWHKKLFDYCNEREIQFLSTPCDTEAVDLLLKIGSPALKISSDDLININLLEYVAMKNIPVILSTGMADASEIDTAVGIFKKYNNKNLVLLHCTSCYPTPESEVNLNRMRSIVHRYDILTGYSDHTKGFMASLGAAFMGSVVIEKHFTLSRQMDGPDHSFSLEPHELKRMIKTVRLCERLRGDARIKESTSEKPARLKYRRGIVASHDLKTGIRLREDHLAYKRPGDGLKPVEKHKLIGKRLTGSVKKDEKILLENLED